MKCASTASKFQWPCEVAKPGQAERAPVAQAKPRLLKERSLDGIEPHMTPAPASARILTPMTLANRRQNGVRAVVGAVAQAPRRQGGQNGFDGLAETLVIGALERAA